MSSVSGDLVGGDIQLADLRRAGLLVVFPLGFGESTGCRLGEKILREYSWVGIFDESLKLEL